MGLVAGIDERLCTSCPLSRAVAEQWKRAFQGCLVDGLCMSPYSTIKSSGGCETAVREVSSASFQSCLPASDYSLDLTVEAFSSCMSDETIEMHVEDLNAYTMKYHESNQEISLQIVRPLLKSLDFGPGGIAAAMYCVLGVYFEVC